MSGVRIHHRELRNCVLIIRHPGDPRTGRKAKDYHIHIDNEGDSIVSETVLMRLQQASPNTFVVLNEILHPPTLRIGVNDGQVVKEQKRVYKQLQDIAREFAPDGVVPRITNGKDK